MLQKLSVNKILLSLMNYNVYILKFNNDFTNSYNEESEEGNFLKVDTQYPEKLLERYNDLPFLPERMKT